MIDQSNVPSFNFEADVEEWENDFEPMPLDNIYTLELVSLEPRESKFQNTDGSKKTDILWTFEIIEPTEFTGRKLTYWTSSKLSRTKKSGKPNKTLKLLGTLYPNKEIKIGQKIDFGRFVGYKLKATLKNSENNDGSVWQSIGEIMPIIKENKKEDNPTEEPKKETPVEKKKEITIEDVPF